eukprot:Skav217312  [mRNA]  locus=scaffold3163:62132:62764:+ [translate_table: standard]
MSSQQPRGNPEAKKVVRKNSKQLVKQLHKTEKRLAAVGSHDATKLVAGNDFTLHWKSKRGSQLSIQDESRKRWHLTDSALLIAALRRNLSNIATKDFGAVTLCDMHKAVLCRAEVLLGASRVGSFRMFHESWDEQIVKWTNSDPDSDVDPVGPIRDGEQHRGDSSCVDKLELECMEEPTSPTLTVPIVVHSFSFPAGMNLNQIGPGPNLK